MPTYVHKFIPNVGASRTLKNAPARPGLLQVAQLERATAQANMGWADYAATISLEEYEAHPLIYIVDTTVILYDAEDPENIDVDGNFQAIRECWAGSLNEPVAHGGTVQLSAGGHGKRADREKRHWLWMDNTTDRYTTTDKDSDLNYDSDEQIKVEVKPRALKASVAHKTEFRWPTGHTTLKADAASGDDKVDVGNADGLKKGMSITIGGIVRTVADSYHKNDTTVKLTATLGTAKVEGTVVTFNPGAHPNRWASHIGGYYPNVHIGGVRFDIDVPAGRDDHMHLEVARAVGPDGAKTVLDNFALTKHRDDLFVDFGNNKDLVLFGWWREDEDKNADHHLSHVRNLRTYGKFTTAETYDSWKIVRDIGDELGWDTTGVDETTTDGLPFALMPGRASEGLDAQAILDDFVWLLLGAETPELKFREWGRTTWVVTDPHPDPDLNPMAQYDHLLVAYSMENGFEDVVDLTASPNPLAGGQARYFPRTIFEGDRPPPLALAMSFGQPVINELSRPKQSGTHNTAALETEDAPGVPAVITRVRPGDVAKHPLINNRTQRIAGTSLNGDGTVTLTYPDKYFRLERAEALHAHLMNQGRNQTKSTLAGLGLREPIKATNLTGGHKRIETRGGHHHYDGYANWNAVTEDVNGRAIFMREYVVYFRYRDAVTGVLATDDDGGTIIREKHVKLDNLTENPTQLPTRCRLPNIRNPHKWNLEFAVDSVSMQHKHSGKTAYTSIGKPTLPSAPQPTTLTQTVDQHNTKADWDCNDATETDSAGDSMLAQGIGQFKIVRFKNGVRYGKILRTRSTHKSWPTPKITEADTLRTDVYGEDHYGNLSTVATVSTGRGSPPTPVAAPGPFTFDRGGKGGIRGKLPFTYTGTDPDFHMMSFVIEWQAEDHTPTGSDPVQRKTHKVAIADANSAQQVLIRRLKAGEQVRARYYAQATKGGHLSAPSPYSTVQTVTAPKKPGKVSNRRIRTKTRGVLGKWNAPTAWDDATTEGFSETEVAYYIASLTNAAGTILNDADGNPFTVKTRADHHFFPTEAGDAAAKGVEVTAYGWDDGFVSPDSGATATQAAPGGLGVVAGDIPSGSIDYSKISSTMPASAPPGSYGTPVSNGATPPRYYLVSGPSGSWKTGDWVMNLSTSVLDLAPHMYRYESSEGRWYRVADESFYADTIVGGTISGVIIQGSLFRTAAPNATRVEIDSGASDRIRFFNSGYGSGSDANPVGQILASTSDLEIYGPGSTAAVKIFADKVRLSAASHTLTLQDNGDLLYDGVLVAMISRTHRHTINANSTGIHHSLTNGTTRKYGGATENTAHWHEVTTSSLSIDDHDTHSHGGQTELASL